MKQLHFIFAVTLLSLSFGTLSLLGEENILLPGGIPLELIKVEHGEFTMGKRDGENRGNEKLHTAVLTRDFFLGKYEVTQEQYEAVTGKNPSLSGKFPRNPVENVSWNDAMDFCEMLNRSGCAPQGWKFSLPTDTQWEYAASGAGKSRNFKYSGGNCLAEVAWYFENSGGVPHAVGTRKPNELGFYDMSGNVWEWCLDDYGGSTVGSPEFSRNSKSDMSNDERVNRGGGCNDDFKGGWSSVTTSCRTASRDANGPEYRNHTLGFRVALVPEKY